MEALFSIHSDGNYVAGVARSSETESAVLVWEKTSLLDKAIKGESNDLEYSSSYTWHMNSSNFRRDSLEGECGLEDGEDVCLKVNDLSSKLAIQRENVGPISKNVRLAVQHITDEELEILVIVLSDKQYMRRWQYDIASGNLRLMFYNEAKVSLADHCLLIRPYIRDLPWYILRKESKQIVILNATLDVTYQIPVVTTTDSNLCFLDEDHIVTISPTNRILVIKLSTSQILCNHKFSIDIDRDDEEDFISNITLINSFGHSNRHTKEYKCSASTSDGLIYVFNILLSNIEVLVTVDGTLDLSNPMQYCRLESAVDADSRIKERKNSSILIMCPLFVGRKLLVVTSTTIVLIDILRMKIVSGYLLRNTLITLLSQATVLVHQSKVNTNIILGLVSSFEKQGKTIVFDLSDSENFQCGYGAKSIEATRNVDYPISLFMRAIDDEDNENIDKSVKSILMSTMHSKTQQQVSNLPKSMSTGLSWEKPVKDKNGKHIDMPVTFTKNIKSSGYGQGPKDSFEKAKQKKLLAKQKEELNRKKERALLTLQKASKGPLVSIQSKVYPLNSDPPSISQAHLTYPSTASAPLPIIRLLINETGNNLAMLTTGNHIQTVNLPIESSNEGRSYLGHDGRLTDAHFSHTSNMILSTSVDGTAKLWKGSNNDSPAINFSHTLHEPSILRSVSNQKSSPSSVSTVRNKPFASEITSGRFYYMDKFVALAIKSNVNLYLYDLNDYDNVDDVNRYESRGKYELCHQWTLPGQTITTMTCLNSIQSPILFAATSDKSVHILDAVRGEVAIEIASCHSRSIHRISLPQPSIYVPLSTSTPEYNLFATSSIDNVIALWDVRTGKSVCRYSGHINRREAIGCEISPCLRYIATGSEDKSCRIIDIRGGAKELCRLVGHKDVVTDVSWHPYKPQLATSSLDGTVRFYNSPDIQNVQTRQRSEISHRLAR